MAENKVQYNLKNCHYAVLTETVTSGVTSESWSTPVAIPGAVSVTLNPDGDETIFYADGVKYYQTRANNGYSGTIEFARIPDSMLTAVWGQTVNSSNVLIETNADLIKEFALLFEIDGDQDEEYNTFYKCYASRPGITAQTNKETRDPQTQTLNISIAALHSNGKIKARTTATTTSTVKNGWFSAVYNG